MAHLQKTITSFGRTFLEGMLHLFYPRICWICQQMQPLGQPGICDDCRNGLEQDARPTCPRCASTVGPYVDLSQGCAFCKDSKFAFDQTFRLGPYEGLLRDAVLRMKGRHGEGLAEAVGEFWAGRMVEKLRPLAPDVVVPVPLHWFRQLRRGFNSSEVLARSLAIRLGIPCRAGWLRRVRRTEEQKVFQAAHTVKRWDNVRGAFAVRLSADVAGKTIVLIDDVLTTGATASEAARPLRALKPRRIIVAVAAHGR